MIPTLPPPSLAPRKRSPLDILLGSEDEEQFEPLAPPPVPQESIDDLPSYVLDKAGQFGVNAGTSALSALGTAAHILDTPGRGIRRALVGANPFGDEEVYGRDILEAYGLADEERHPGVFTSPEDTVADIGGFAIDMLTDPFTYTGFGPYTKLGWASKMGATGRAAAKKAATAADDAVRYADDLARAADEGMGAVDDAAEIAARAQADAAKKAAAKAKDEVPKELLDAPDLADTWGNAIRQGQMGLVEVGLPFSWSGGEGLRKSLVYGTGENAAKVADALGAPYRALRGTWGGRQLAKILDPAVQDADTLAGQQVASDAFHAADRGRAEAVEKAKVARDFRDEAVAARTPKVEPEAPPATEPSPAFAQRLPLDPADEPVFIPGHGVTTSRQLDDDISDLRFVDELGGEQSLDDLFKPPRTELGADDTHLRLDDLDDGQVARMPDKDQAATFRAAKPVDPLDATRQTPQVDEDALTPLYTGQPAEYAQLLPDKLAGEVVGDAAHTARKAEVQADLTDKIARINAALGLPEAATKQQLDTILRMGSPDAQALLGKRAELKADLEDLLSKKAMYDPTMSRRDVVDDVLRRQPDVEIPLPSPKPAAEPEMPIPPELEAQLKRELDPERFGPAPPIERVEELIAKGPMEPETIKANFRAAAEAGDGVEALEDMAEALDEVSRAKGGMISEAQAARQTIEDRIRKLTDEVDNYPDDGSIEGLEQVEAALKAEKSKLGEVDAFLARRQQAPIEATASSIPPEVRTELAKKYKGQELEDNIAIATPIVQTLAKQQGVSEAEMWQRILPGGLKTYAGRYRGKLAQEGGVVGGIFDAAKKMIGLYRDAKPTTFVHEFGHAILPHLDDASKGLLETEARKMLGAVDDAGWDRAFNEWHSESWENYIATGRAPTPQLQGVFERMKELFSKFIETIKTLLASKGGKRYAEGISPETAKVFDDLMNPETAQQILKAEPARVEKLAPDLPPPVMAAQRTAKNVSPPPLPKELLPSVSPAATVSASGDFAGEVADIVRSLASGPSSSPESAGSHFFNNKVFISHIWERYKAAHPEVTKQAFDEMLRNANRERKLTLSRADLVQAMNEADWKPSEIPASVDVPTDGTFHFVRADALPAKATDIPASLAPPVSPAEIVAAATKTKASGSMSPERIKKLKASLSELRDHREMAAIDGLSEDYQRLDSEIKWIEKQLAEAKSAKPAATKQVSPAIDYTDLAEEAAHAAKVAPNAPTYSGDFPSLKAYLDDLDARGLDMLDESRWNLSPEHQAEWLARTPETPAKQVEIPASLADEGTPPIPDSLDLGLDTVSPQLPAEVARMADEYRVPPASLDLDLDTLKPYGDDAVDSLPEIEKALPPAAASDPDIFRDIPDELLGSSDDLLDELPPRKPITATPLEEILASPKADDQLLKEFNDLPHSEKMPYWQPVSDSIVAKYGNQRVPPAVFDDAKRAAAYQWAKGTPVPEALGGRPAASKAAEVAVPAALDTPTPASVVKPAKPAVAPKPRSVIDMVAGKGTPAEQQAAIKATNEVLAENPGATGKKLEQLAADRMAGKTKPGTKAPPLPKEVAPPPKAPVDGGDAEPPMDEVAREALPPAASSNFERVARRFAEGVKWDDADLKWIGEEPQKFAKDLEEKFINPLREMTEEGLDYGIVSPLNDVVDYFPRSSSGAQAKRFGKTGLAPFWDRIVAWMKGSKQTIAKGKRATSVQDYDDFAREAHLSGWRDGTDGLNEAVRTWAGDADSSDMRNWLEKRLSDKTTELKDGTQITKDKRIEKAAKFLSELPAELKGDAAPAFFDRSVVDDLHVGLQRLNKKVSSASAIFKLFATEGGDEGLGMIEALRKAGIRTGKQDAESRVLSRMLKDNADVLSKKGVHSIADLEKLKVNEDYVRDALRILKSHDDPDYIAPLLEAWDKGTDIFRTSATILWPANWARNFLSGQYVNLVSGGFSPSAFAEATNIVQGKPSKYWDEMVMHSVLDPKAGHRGYGSTHGSTVSDLLDKSPMTPKDMYNKYRDEAKLPGPLGAWEAGGHAAAGTVEALNRATHYIARRQQGYAPYEAAQETLKAHFDYARGLTTTERSAVRRMVPFYCMPEDHEALSRDGWKRHDELKVGDEILAIDHETRVVSWQPVQAIHTYDYDGELNVVERTGRARADGTCKAKWSFWCTDDHKWPVETVRNFVKGKWYGGKKSLLPFTEIHAQHAVPLTGDFFGEESILTPRLAAILGWVVTDGHARRRQHRAKVGSLQATGPGSRVKNGSWEMVVYQSPVKHLNEVVALLESEPHEPHPITGVVCTPVRSEDRHAILEVFQSKSDLPGIAARLSREAAEAMFWAIIKAEGTPYKSGGDGHVVTQIGSNRPVIDALQILCALTGRTTSVSTTTEKRTGRAKYICYVRTRKTLRLKAWGHEKRHYKGVIWCPQTPLGTWLVRHEGTTCFTGNSFAKFNMPWNLEQLIRHPGGAVAQSIRATDTARRDTVIPPWMEGKFAMALGPSGDGESFKYISGLGLPYEEAFERYYPGDIPRTIQAHLGMAHPAIKMPLELAAGKQFFSGRDLDSLQPWPTGNQVIDQAIFNSPASRAVSTVRTALDDRKGLIEKVLNIGTGVKVTDVDMARAAKAAQREDLLRLLEASPNVQGRRVYSARKGAELTPEEQAALKEYRGNGKAGKKASVSVKKYRDNPDGTTTHFLSDGTEETVRLVPQADGSMAVYDLQGRRLSA